MCAIATVDVTPNGQLKFTRHGTYFTDHERLDRAFGWGFTWKEATK
ncbi:hypothetical protein [Sporomusa carbonis]